MSYVRKIVVFILSILFLAAVVVGMSVVFAVRNVNVELLKYSEEYLDEYEESKENLAKLKGTSILYLSEDDVKSCVSSGHMVLQSFEKVFPCTINVVIKERVETFAFKTSSGYEIYDEDGILIGSSPQNVNGVDGCPNVLLQVAPGEIAEAVQMCGYFSERFSALRGAVESVEIRGAAFGVDSTMTLKLFSGLTLVVIDYEVYPEQKMEAIYNEYLLLSSRQRLYGSILASAPGGELSAVAAAYFG